MTHVGTIKLETDKLILRRLSELDDEAMFNNWANDEEVTKFLMWKPHASIDITRQLLCEWSNSYDNLDFYMWGIELKETHELIGCISVVDINKQTNTVQIGYCIGKKWWNNGFTSEALTRLVEFFFARVNVNRIEAKFDPRNQNSGKVMKKAGMQYEGTLREAGWNNQGCCDSSYYAILAKDYLSKTK